MHIIHVEPRPLQQGGMSEAVRQFDWSKTSLGPMHRWPASLRIAVDLLLASKFPGCLVWGRDMVSIHNDAFVPILGTKPEPLGRGFHEVWSDVWDGVGALAFRALQGEAVFQENLPLVTSRNGVLEQVYFTFSYSPVRDENGDVVGFLDTVLETTSNVESERQWRDLACSFEKQVQERSTEHQRLWELSSDLMLVVQGDLRLRTFNPACRQQLGWDDGTVGQPLLDIAHPDDAGHLAQLLDGSQQSGEGRLRHVDGHYRWFNFGVMPATGSVTLVGRDITQEREREMALRQAEELLRHGQKMEAVGQLTGGMAHDFNNMLAGISASLEMLERRIAKGQTQDLGKYLHAARQASERAAQLTHRLLAFSRRQPLAPRPTDLNELLNGIQPLILQVIGPDVNLQLQVDPQPWLLLVDISQMESALINLCANARDAMNRHGSLKISTSNERHETTIPGSDVPPGDYCCLRVEDDGCGMAAEIVQRAFDPFFTTKPAGEGTGLGLSMVYGFVRQSGGRVWITSEEGRGTRVDLLLPRYVGPSMPLPQPLKAAPASSAQLRNERILLIDDEPTLRMLIKEALLDQGLEVLDAADAASGLALYDSAGPIDLVVSDIGLPGGISGIQVAQRLRSRSPDLPVLFITGFTEEAIDPCDVLAPGLELMTKPFGLDALVHKVTAMLHPTRPVLAEDEAHSA